MINLILPDYLGIIRHFMIVFHGEFHGIVLEVVTWRLVHRRMVVREPVTGSGDRATQFSFSIFFH